MQIPATAVVERLAALHESAKRAMADLTQQQLDQVPGAEMSSLAVLVVHITGVERFYLGVMAGGRTNERDRPAEFATAGVSYAALCRRLDDSMGWCAAVVEGLTDADMAQLKLWQPATTVPGREVSGAWAVLMGLSHVAEHVGQMQITRDIVLGKVEG